MRLVVADVNGTLVTPDKILTPRAREAVREVMKANIAFAITSGLCDGELAAHRTASYKYVPPERVGILKNGYVAFPPPWLFNDGAARPPNGCWLRFD